MSSGDRYCSAFAKPNKPRARLMSTLAVARLELRYLFYSPIAWVLFLVFSLLTFQRLMSGFDRLLTMESSGQIGAFPLTEILYSYSFGVFGLVEQNLFLFIPLLTMAAISRELHSGSISVVLSSPLGLSRYIAGKFIAVFCLGLSLVLVVTSTSILANVAIDNLDVGLVVSGIVGIFLITAMYTAIGLCMSAITEYQVIAAIGSITALLALNLVGDLFPPAPIVSDVAHWVSIPGRLRDSFFGLLNSANVFYFVAMTGTFLFISVKALELRFERQNRVKNSAATLAVCVLVICLGIFISRPENMVFLDLTSDQSMTLSTESQKAMNAIRGPWKITTYVDVLAPGSSFYKTASRRALFGRFEKYTRFNPALTIEYVYFENPKWHESIQKTYEDLTVEMAIERIADDRGIDRSQLIPAEEVAQRTGIGEWDLQTFNVIEWQGKSVFLWTFDDTEHFPGEQQISAALKALSRGPTRVGFLTDRNARDPYGSEPQDFGSLIARKPSRYSLVNLGFEVVEVSTLQESIASVDILVVVAPDTVFDSREITEIQNFLIGGGSLLVLAEPNTASNLNPLLSLLDLRIGDKTVSSLASSGFARSTLLADYGMKDEFSGSRFLPDAPIMMMGAVRIESVVGNISQAEIISAANIGGVSETLEKAMMTRESMDQAVVAIALTRRPFSNEFRAAVVGDADFMSNGGFYRRGTPTNNMEFVTDLFRWLAHGEYPIDDGSSDFEDRSLSIASDWVTTINWFGFAVWPTLVLCLGGFVVIQRLRT